MKTSNHIHRFKRSTYATGNKFYFCVNNCNFRVSCELSLGKVSECNRCGKPFSMNKYAITLDKPHCEDCHAHKGDKKKSKNKKQVQTVQPLTIVSELVGNELVTDLKQRLNELTSEQQPKPKIYTESPGVVWTDKPIIHVEDTPVQTQTIIKEFKLEDEEEFL